MKASLQMTILMVREFTSTKQVDIIMGPGWMANQMETENDCIQMELNIQENGKITSEMAREY